jgi:microcystin-dependent protein
MPETASARLGLVGPSATDLVSQGDDIIRAIVAQLEVVAARIDYGSAASRPAAGIVNRFYRSSDTGVLSLDTGSAWIDLNLKDAAAATASLRTLGTGAKQAAAGSHAAQHARGGADAIPGLPPIGGMLPYAGNGDPAGGDWLLADGRLIDRTTYSAFYTAVGHIYNGGVDPGSNKVRIPDKRGRASIGADNMATAQGAAGRLPNSNRARGENGGEERHTLTSAEVPNLTVATGSASVPETSPTVTVLAQPGTGGPVDLTASGGGGAHTNMQPYECDNWLVRVL